MIALLVLVIVVVVAVLLARNSSGIRGGSRPDPPAGGASRRPVGRPAAALVDDLDRWVRAGLLAADQAEAILEHEKAGRRPAPVAVTAETGTVRASSRVPVVAEAVGYLGGVLALIGVVLVLAHYWPDLAWAGRLGLSGAAAVVFVVGGAVVHAGGDAALVRLRAFLWLLSTAATAVFAGVLVTEGRDLADQTVVFWCAVAVAVQSGLLWQWRDRPVQQLTALAGAAVALGTGVALVLDEGPAGIAVGLLGAGYLALGLTRRIPTPVLAELVGAVTLLVAGPMVSSDWEGVGLLAGVAIALGLLGLVVAPGVEMGRADRLAVGLPAAVVGSQIIPSTLVYFAQGAGVVTGLVTWLVGAGLLVAVARGRTRLPVVTEVMGGVALVGGAALTGTQWPAFAPLLGLATAVALLVIGMRPGRVLLSVIGALGLLVNVPWAVGELFPGEGRAPLLIMVAGVVLVVVAVLLARQGDRFRQDLGSSETDPGRPVATR